MTKYFRSTFLTIFILVIFFVLSSCNNEPAVNSINEKDLRIHLEFIASDLLKGREAGSSDCNTAAAYIIGELEKMGISPYHSDSGYIQLIDTNTILTNYSGENFIHIINNNGSEIILNDIIVTMFPPKASIVQGDTVIYAGYGLPGQSDIDFRKKIVLIQTGRPGIQNNPDSFNPEFEYEKLKNAYNKGANSVIWIFNTSETKAGFHKFMSLVRYPNDSILAINEMTLKISQNTVFITNGTAANILKLSNKSIYDKPFIIDNTVIGIRVERKKVERKLMNVIGIIEGSDPELKNEYIIYVAHYDHLGTINGVVFNGADDNGSGTVALIEIAQAYMLSPEKPKRSIVFAWMDGEEIGLIGSKYYTNHPLFPLDSTLLCINLDMVGRVKTPADTGFVHGKNVDVQEADSINVTIGNLRNELLKIQVSNCLQSGMFAKYKFFKIKAESDHYPFYKKGIPVIFYSTGLHPQYHTAEDDISLINYFKIKRVAQLAFMVGYDAANIDME